MNGQPEEQAADDENKKHLPSTFDSLEIFVIAGTLGAYSTLPIHNYRLPTCLSRQSIQNPLRPVVDGPRENFASSLRIFPIKLIWNVFYAAELV